jgi:AbiV family abortive infection protein
VNVDDFAKKLTPPALVTVDEFADGMHFSYRNAKQLVEDARTLRSQSPARAMALAILAMEEIGKIFLLYEIVISNAGQPVAGTEVARRVRTHSKKQMAFAMYGSHIDPSHFGYEIGVPSRFLNLLDQVKQLGFYVDLTKGGFAAPSHFGEANEHLADWAIDAAYERLDSVEGLHSSPESSREFIQFGLHDLTTVVDAVVQSGGIDSPDAEAAVRDALQRIMTESDAQELD